MSDSNENIEITSSKKVAMSKEKKGGLMTETAHHKNPPGVHLLDVKISSSPHAVVKLTRKRSMQKIST